MFRSDRDPKNERVAASSDAVQPVTSRSPPSTPVLHSSPSQPAAQPCSRRWPAPISVNPESSRHHLRLYRMRPIPMRPIPMRPISMRPIRMRLLRLPLLRLRANRCASPLAAVEPPGASNDGLCAVHRGSCRRRLRLRGRSGAAPAAGGRFCRRNLGLGALRAGRRQCRRRVGLGQPVPARTGVAAGDARRTHWRAGLLDGHCVVADPFHGAAPDADRRRGLLQRRLPAAQCDADCPSKAGGARSRIRRATARGCRCDAAGRGTCRSGHHRPVGRPRHSTVVARQPLLAARGLAPASDSRDQRRGIA